MTSPSPSATPAPAAPGAGIVYPCSATQPLARHMLDEPDVVRRHACDTALLRLAFVDAGFAATQLQVDRNTNPDKSSLRGHFLVSANGLPQLTVAHVLSAHLEKATMMVASFVKVSHWDKDDNLTGMDESSLQIGAFSTNQTKVSANAFSRDEVLDRLKFMGLFEDDSLVSRWRRERCIAGLQP